MVSARSSNLWGGVAIFLVVLLIGGSAVVGDTIYVDDDGPADFNNIQAAISDANDGDTVLVADGTHTGPGNRDIDFLGKAITVRSSNPEDPCIVAATIIDCNGSQEDQHRGFYFQNGEDANSVISGLTITNGFYGAWGGGIFCWSASPTIANCTFTGNWSGDGGAINNYYYSSPNITNCTFTDNSADNWSGAVHNQEYSNPNLTNCTFTNNGGALVGGAMGNWYSNPTLINCTFNGNFASYGAMHNYYSNPTIIDCTFSNNPAIQGGAMFNAGSSPTLTNCTFTGNSSDHHGGAIHNAAYCSPILTNCTFTGNSADEWGGGMYNTGDSNAILTDCIFSGNSAGDWGGAICNIGCDPILTNCTLTKNVADSGSAAIHNIDCNLTLTNCILWQNIPQELYIFSSATAVINYSDVQGWISGPGETGNINANPRFAHPGYWHPNGTPDDANDDFWVSGDYHLKSQGGRYDPTTQSWVYDDVTSPCIDAGDPMSPIGAEPFPNGGVVNIGAYGATEEASKSYFGKPPCEIIVAGDVNGDCVVDFLDFRLMALHWCESIPAEPTVNYQVGECTGRSDSKTLLKTEPTRFSVEVRGSHIHFEDIIPGNCCPDKLELQMTLEDDLIIIFEDEYLNSPCRCTCSYPTSATSGPFDDGTYSLDVYKREFVGEQAVSTVPVGSTTVTIGMDDE
ncbi:MAG: hypothetical protein ISS79_04045 [Phycisphaerae bacterium]|nr:hypothetical protein [Phycisphaerae bacterium]